MLTAGGILRTRYLLRGSVDGLAAALSSNARQVAVNVGYWLAERRSDATVAGRNVANLAGSTDGFRSLASIARITSSLEGVRELYNYHDALVVDTTGAIVARAGARDVRLSATELAAARSAIESGRSTMVDPYRDEQGHIILAFVAAVAPGPPIGAVILRTDLNTTLLVRLPVGLPGSETGQSRLVGRVGGEAVVISGSVYPKAAPFSLRGPWDSAAAAIRIATSGKDSSGLFADALDRQILAAVQHVPGTSWGVVRSISEAEVLAGYRKQVVAEFGAAILAGVILVLLAVLAYRAMRALNERDTAASRALLAEAQALSRMGSWSWDPHSGRMTWTPALYHILGCEAESFTPSFDAMIHAAVPDDRPALKSALDALVAQGEPFALDYQVRRPDGMIRSIHATCRAIPRPGGGPPISLGVMRDTTERRELEARLAQAQKMEAIGLLAGGVAHDFNNMLTVVIGSCDLLADQCHGNAVAMGEVRELRRVAEAAAALTGQLLAFSRQQVVQMHDMDLNATVLQSESLIRRGLPESIELRLQLSRRPAWVRGDPGQIQQVLLNLAFNARDALPEGGTFTLGTEVRLDGATGAGAVVLTASDTGSGMPPDVLARVFEPFFTTKERGKGTGLGLSTAQGIITQFGGEMTAESAPGRGAVFTITLPYVASVALPEGARTAAPVRMDGTETILLVEDDEAVRRGTRRILQHHGYRVLEAADGAGGVRLAATFAGHIDLLLTDVVMPNLIGSEVARQITSLRPGIKVVLMSGYADDAVLRRGLSAGRYPFLQKPFDRNELATLIRQTLGLAG